ncbi:RNA polymerase sigma factor [Streptomyces sp. NPDC020875]|uniref:RNA polymerase sigma factor n=1 Tax=Streptomyces sp. NPDC020875 TaxID=3154898 RepID=UPI0033BFE825
MGVRNEEREAALERAVRRAQRGEETAFAWVYATVQPTLLAYLSRLVGPDAEDVASDSWLDIVRDLSRFHGSGSGFTAWARTIAHHRAVDHLRRRRSRPRTALLDHDIHDFPGPRDTALEALETLATERALSLIAILPDRQARAVLLRTVIGLDTATTARLLRARRSDVRSATHRGLKGLARYLTFTDPTPAQVGGDQPSGTKNGCGTACAIPNAPKSGSSRARPMNSETGMSKRDHSPGPKSELRTSVGHDSGGLDPASQNISSPASFPPQGIRPSHPGR